MLKERILEAILVTKSQHLNGITLNEILNESYIKGISKIEMNIILVRVLNISIEKADELIHSSGKWKRIPDENGRIDITDHFEEVWFYDDFFREYDARQS